MTGERARGGAWPLSATFVSHGARFRVRTNDPGAMSAITARLPPGSRRVRSSSSAPTYSLFAAPAGSNRPHALHRDGQRLRSGAALDGLLAELESELHFAVATGARSALFVHAGAVVFRERGLLLPGRSMSGKSELTAALVAAGATYYSDEYAVLDTDGRLHAYPKSISLRCAAGRSHVAALAPAERPPVPVGTVVVTRYVEGAAWRPRALTRGEAMAALLQHTVLARVRPRAAMAVLARTASVVAALEGDRGEAELTAAALLAAADANLDCAAARGRLAGP